jgi:hypothetical protein
MRAYITWCIGGFLFPIAIWLLGWVFERAFPPGPDELGQTWLTPDFLASLVFGLLIAHLAAAALAAWWWPRLGVRLVTTVQVLASLVAAFLASMAVTGVWL